MNAIQKSFRLSTPRIPSESAHNHTWRTQTLNGKHPRGPVPPEKLLAEMVKRQARVAMRDVTDCPPNTIPAHLARLDDLIELARHVLQHSFADDPEATPSGCQLLHPETLADYLAALLLTRQQHRAPTWINATEKRDSEILHKLDVIAAHLNRPALCQLCGGAL